MATIRMRNYQLNLIHQSIELARAKLEKKEKKLKKKIKNKKHYLVHERLKFEEQLKKVQVEIQRYETIDEMILKTLVDSNN